MTKSGMTERNGKKSRDKENLGFQNRGIIDEMSQRAQVLRIEKRDSESRLFHQLISIVPSRRKNKGKSNSQLL